MKLLFLLIGSSLAVAGCHVNVGDSNNSGNGDSGNTAKTTTYATYEMLEGCSTGIKKFNAGSEEELTVAYCDGLKNNEANGNCAQYQREQAFKAMGCAGTWPYPTASGLNSSSSQSYSYKVNSCSTGFHYISASTPEQGNKAYCKQLQNDELNMNCARSKRDEAFAQAECKAE